MARRASSVDDLLDNIARRREWPLERRVAARTNALVSTRELASVLGVTHTTVNNWERKGLNPSSWELEKDYFDVLQRLEEAVA